MSTLADLNDRLIDLMAEHEAACDAQSDCDDADDAEDWQMLIDHLEEELKHIEELIETGDYDHPDEAEDIDHEEDRTPTNFEEHKLWT